MAPPGPLPFVTIVELSRTLTVAVGSDVNEIPLPPGKIVAGFVR